MTLLVAIAETVALVVVSVAVGVEIAIWLRRSR